MKILCVHVRNFFIGYRVYKKYRDRKRRDKLIFRQHTPARNETNLSLYHLYKSIWEIYSVWLYKIYSCRLALFVEKSMEFYFPLSWLENYISLHFFRGTQGNNPVFFSIHLFPITVFMWITFTLTFFFELWQINFFFYIFI